MTKNEQKTSKKRLENDIKRSKTGKKRANV